MQKIKKITDMITGIDYELMNRAQERLDNLTKPQGSLGRLEELAKLVVGITRKENPRLKNKVIFTLAADHGVTEEKVSAFPKEVTAQMVYNFISGGAGINVLAGHISARVMVVDVGVAAKLKIPVCAAGRQNSKINPSTMLRIDGESFDYAQDGSSKDGELVEPRSRTIKNFKDKKINLGTQNFTKGPAMTRLEAIKSIETGIEIFEDGFKCGIDIIGTGDMGIGNTTASSAITSVFTGRTVEEVTGRGTGIDDAILKNKIEVVKRAIGLNKPNPEDPIDVLSKVGGFEIGGLVGIILAAAAKRIPVVIDGFISGAAALIAYHIEPKVKDYMIASHCSAEKGHRFILEHIGLKPILDLNLRLGEGTGAALGINIVEAAVKILTQMATFKGAGVAEKIK